MTMRISRHALQNARLEGQDPEILLYEVVKSPFALYMYKLFSSKHLDIQHAAYRFSKTSIKISSICNLKT